jgi:hypothetical protein
MPTTIPPKVFQLLPIPSLPSSFPVLVHKLVRYSDLTDARLFSPNILSSTPEDLRYTLSLTPSKYLGREFYFSAKKTNALLTHYSPRHLIATWMQGSIIIRVYITILYTYLYCFLLEVHIRPAPWKRVLCQCSLPHPILNALSYLGVAWRHCHVFPTPTCLHMSEVLGMLGRSLLHREQQDTSPPARKQNPQQRASVPQIASG